MAKYRIKPGCYHGSWIAEGVHEYGPGDIVELDERAAAGFLDKMELVEDEVEETAVPELVTAVGDLAAKPAAKSTKRKANP